MKLSAIFALLACLALVNSSAIEEKEETTSWTQLPMRMITRVKSMLGDMKRKLHVLNNTVSTNPRCLYKMPLCSRPNEKPVIADHFRGAAKSAGKLWRGLFDNKSEKQAKDSTDKWWQKLFKKQTRFITLNGRQYEVSFDSQDFGSMLLNNDRFARSMIRDTQ